MKIARIRAYRVNLPVKGGRYSWFLGLESRLAVLGEALVEVA